MCGPKRQDKRGGDRVSEVKGGSWKEKVTVR